MECWRQQHLPAAFDPHIHHLYLASGAGSKAEKKLVSW